MSTAYSFPPVTFNPSTPDWARLVMTNMQAQRDLEYSQALDHFYGRSQTWIDANQKARDMSPTPASYAATPFTDPIPAREVMDWNGNGFRSKQVTDPNVHGPVLPPYQAPATGQFTTGAPALEAGNQAVMATIINMLLAIKTKTDKLP